MDLEDYVAQLHAETDAASEPSGIYKNIISHLPSMPSTNCTFFQDGGDRIFSRDPDKLSALMDLFEDLGLIVGTGYYDPEEDEEAGMLDEHTALYYLEVC